MKLICGEKKKDGISAIYDSIVSESALMISELPKINRKIR